MALKTRLNLTQSQSLALTPALRASIQLLQLSASDLEAFVEAKLEENPFLERLEGPSGAGRLASSQAAVDGLAATAADKPSLTQHLLNQIALSFVGLQERAVALTLLEELDESGYLTGDWVDLAQRLDPLAEGRGSARPEAVLKRLQALEPSGVFARSLAECLALQVAAKGWMDPLFRQLLDRLDLLARSGPSALAEALGVAPDRLASYLDRLRSLDPKPGLGWQDEAPPPRIPDLLVTPAGRGFQVTINPEGLSRVGLDRAARAHLLPRLRKPEERRYASERLQEVSWLRRALERRYETLLLVGDTLVAQQAAFFRQGAAGLKPLTRRTLAEQLDLSEATISRVVANKYLASPRGIEPLKRFFSAGLGETGTVSAAAAQARLQELVANEPSNRPLSDQALATRLSEGGWPVARRTVAKYRTLLRIPAAAERRRAPAEQPKV
ncbi:MAG: RNA polymerase factor sigma-54 [Pseudomonadota bacterium]